MTSPSRFFLPLLLLLPLAFALPAAADGIGVLAPGGWTLSLPHPADAALDPAPSPDGETERVTVKTPSDPFYAIQIVRGVSAAVPEGHRLRLRFRARSATRNPIRADIEKSGPPFTSLVERSVTLTPDWQPFDLAGTSPGYAPGGLSVHFQMGHQAGTVEIAGDPRHRRGHGPGPRRRPGGDPARRGPGADREVPQGTLTVRVVDAEGRPVPNARVHLAQTRHAFLFGCNFFGLNPADTSPSQMAYQNEFTALFNYATLPFYWGAFEGTQGKPDYARLQDAWPRGASPTASRPRATPWSGTRSGPAGRRPTPTPPSPCSTPVWPTWSPAIKDTIHYLGRAERSQRRGRPHAAERREQLDQA